MPITKHKYFGFFAVVLAPAAFCLVLWFVAEFGVNTQLANFDPCLTVSTDSETKSVVAWEIENCVFSPLPSPALASWKSGNLGPRLVPAAEIKARYVFLMLLAVSTIGAIILFVDSMRATLAVSSLRFRNKGIWSPAGAIGVTAMMLGAFVLMAGMLNGGFSNTVTEQVFKNVLKAIPWAAGDSICSECTVFWVFDRAILPFTNGLFAAVVVCYVLSTAMQVAPDPYARQINYERDSKKAADFLARRVFRIRRMMTVAAIVLAFGIATFRAFVNWPLSVLNGVGYEAAARHAETLTSGVVLYWSTLCVAILLSTYLTATFFATRQAKNIDDEEGLSRSDRIAWEKQAGLRIDFGEQLKLVASLLAPLLIGSGDKVVGALLPV